MSHLGGMPRVLLIYGGHAGGRTEKLTAAVRAGIERAGEPVELRAMPALQAGIDELLWADGLLIGTPEHFGYMSGAVKDFFDRTFYPAEGRTEGLPYALYVSAGNDGTGTVAAVTRIATGYRWRAIAEPIIVVGEPDERALERCAELGATMAAGLAAGIF
ncbi:MAG: NAD(P)H-dependent oxidoreductase [Steroidobacteraceae bacterium]|nr:NAD(P)H-dependent oxidoreductase [Steroidobacteraceae bacterium]MDW8260276.1 NAD(P)H-dependent oxidoreductase [Gammaproteobacteria bacterium]